MIPLIQDHVMFFAPRGHRPIWAVGLTLHKEDIRKVLKQAIGKIHLSFDLWTSFCRADLDASRRLGVDDQTPHFHMRRCFRILTLGR
jgi:hypothetical protein